MLPECASPHLNDDEESGSDFLVWRHALLRTSIPFWAKIERKAATKDFQLPSYQANDHYQPLFFLETTVTATSFSSNWFYQPVTQPLTAKM